jgi:simple sugar transport system ATP-binding protein
MKTAPATAAPLLSVHGLTKRFPDVLANDSISMDVFPGEVHALLGENGAGKSTLVKCIYGYYGRDAGEILVDGVPVDLRTPEEARRHAIGMVFQNLTLIPALSAVENVALFISDLPAVPDLGRVARELEGLGERYHLQVDPWAQVQDLSIGQQQKVELLKLLLTRARVLILDEPTRVLAPHEVEGLFQILKRFTSDGLAVIFITHKLDEVLRIADRITVLRRGRVAGSLSRAEATSDRLIRLMFEKDLSAPAVEARTRSAPTAEPILELRRASSHAAGAAIGLNEIDLTIHPGEIVGVAGVSGNGQRELGDLILGELPCVRGSKQLFGKEVTHATIGDLRRDGVSFIPEDPLKMAAVPSLTVLENMALTQSGRYARRAGLGMDWQAVRRDAEASMHRLGFAFSLATQARALSGGNLQRMVVVRELSHDPRLIIASYLTRGLDAQSTRAAQAALLQARREGAGILLISEDLEELFLLSDRLLVMYGGRIVGEFKPEETDVYAVGRWMTGSQAENVPAE